MSKKEITTKLIRISKTLEKRVDEYCQVTGLDFTNLVRKLLIDEIKSSPFDLDKEVNND